MAYLLINPQLFTAVPDDNIIGPPRIVFRSMNTLTLEWDPYPNKKPHEKYIVNRAVFISSYLVYPKVTSNCLAYLYFHYTLFYYVVYHFECIL